MKFTPQMFHAQPRRELDQYLKLRLDAILAQEPREDQQLHLIVIMAEVALVQALRNLTLPEPTTPSWVLTKRHFPENPLSYTQLQQWVQMTIMRVSRVPPIMDYHALVSRQQVLHLLTNMEFIQDGTNS